MFKKHWRSYFSQMFFRYILLSLLCISLVGTLILTFSSASLKGILQEQTQSGIRAVVENLDTLFKNCAEGISELSADQTIQAYLNESADIERFDVARILYLASNSLPDGVSRHIIRLSDGEIVSTGEISPIFHREYFNPNLTLFKRILESDTVEIYTTIKGIHMNRDTRSILGKAVRGKDGTPIGIVVCEVSRSTFVPIVSAYSFVSEQPLLIINNFEAILFNSSGDAGEGLAKLKYKSDIDPIWQENALSGNLEQDNLCWAKLRFANYAVLSEVSSTILNSVYDSTIRALLPVLMIACLMGIVFAFFSARSVSAPIRKLTCAMRETETGNFQALVPVTSRDEMGMLSEAFNHMQLEIAELVARIDEKQRLLRAAEINALVLQVNPHFLYNTLDSIKWCIKLNRTEDAQQIVVLLGKLLRRLMNNQTDTSTIAEEMEIVRPYLQIQKFRQQNKLELCFEIDPEIEACRVPKLMLQPLIENAIVHGLENKMENGKLCLRGQKKGNYIHLTVTDNGAGMTPERLEVVKKLQPNGMYNIGLSNVHRRAILYGDAHCGLTIESRLGIGTEILLILKEMEEDSKCTELC